MAYAIIGSLFVATLLTLLFLPASMPALFVICASPGIGTTLDRSIANSREGSLSSVAYRLGSRPLPRCGDLAHFPR